MSVSFEKKGVSDDPAALAAFYKDLRKFEPLSSDEQIALAVRAKDGDQEAQNSLVNSNQRFIVSITKEYQNSTMGVLDLVSEGNIGLIRSIPKFDETKGIKFLSYAVWWIRQAMFQACYENGDTVRLPVNRINAINKVSKVKERLVQTFEREPTLEEIYEHSNIERGDVFGTLDGNLSMSLDAKVSGDSDWSFVDMLESDTHSDIENGLNKESLINEINDVLSALPLRESDIMNMYFGLNGHNKKTLKEIGEDMSLTNERVRQIKEGVIKKLRSHSKSSRLREFLNVKIN